MQIVDAVSRLFENYPLEMLFGIMGAITSLVLLALLFTNSRAFNQMASRIDSRGITELVKELAPLIDQRAESEAVEHLSSELREWREFFRGLMDDFGERAQNDSKRLSSALNGISEALAALHSVTKNSPSLTSDLVMRGLDHRLTQISSQLESIEKGIDDVRGTNSGNRGCPECGNDGRNDGAVEHQQANRSSAPPAD